MPGDLLVLVISGRDNLPGLPNGWTNIGTSNNGANIYNRTCYKFATASESAVIIADSGVYTAGRMFLFANVDATNPINAFSTNTSGGTSFSATGVTTTADGCMVVHAVTFQDGGTAADTDNYSSPPSNANLSGLREISDNYFYGGSAGVNGGIYLVTGLKATAGTTGNTTSTADSASNYSAVVTFALTPATTGLRPIYVGKSTEARGTGNISVLVPTGCEAGDLLVLALSGRSAVPALPDGWTNIATHNHTDKTFNRTCYKIAASSEGAATVIDSGVYTAGVMLLFKDSDTTNPINASGTSVDDGTTFVAAGVTTTVDKCLVVHVTSFTDSATVNDTSNYGTPSNANLVGLTERNDSISYGSSAGVEAGIHVVTGTKVAAGATGNTSATADISNNYSATVTFAISPPIESEELHEGGSSASVIVPVQGGGSTVRQGVASVTVIATGHGSGVKITAGSSDSQAIISTQAVGAKTGQGSSSASVFVSTYGSGAIARQGDSSSTTTIAGQGYGVKTTGGARDSPIAILVQGGGEKTLKGSSDVTVLLCVNGSGIKITNGFSNTPNIVSVDGLGIKIGFGSSDSIVAICADGNGVVIGGGVGGSEVLVATSSEGDGEKLVTGANEVIVPTSPDGSGTKVSMVSSESIIDISSDANGIKKSGGGEEASVATSVQSGGTKSISFGENSEIVVYIRGDGYRLYSGGSEIFVDISSDGRGFAIRHGGMEPIIFVTPTVDGYGILKTGSSDSIAVTNPCGFGSKSTVGSSDSTVVIGSFGSDYAPVIMIAVFSPNARLTATFNLISAMDAAFNWTADHTAFFRSRQELSAVFVPTIVIGENYGRS